MKKKEVFKLRQGGLWTWISYDWLIKYVKIPAGDDWEKIEDAVRRSNMTLAYRKQFQRFLDDSLLPYLKYPKYRFSMEICPHTYKATGYIQIHFHLFWYHNNGIKETIRATAKQPEFVFKGISPNMPTGSKDEDHAPGPNREDEAPKFRQRSLDKTFNTGLFYISAPKIGHVWDAGNVSLSWSQVHPSLVTKLFADGKMSAQNAKLCYLNCIVNAKHNIDQLNYVMDKRAEFAAERRMRVQKDKVMQSLEKRR